ncbi:protein NYNRIN-like isoform X2 [Anguilla anguilla]|nr:protein NYNRIN-like isoform X2 [Anguilla anguilla]
MVNWSSRGFLTSSGTPIKNGGVVQNLITASKLPNKLAVVKVKAHTKGQDAISLGNHWADEAAKAAALNDSLPTYKIAAIDMSGPTNIDIAKLQDACTRAEKWTWIENACTLNDDNIWHTQDGKVVAPQSILSLLCEVYHGIAHNGERTMRHNMSLHWWSPKMTKVMKDFVRRCIICAKSNQGPKIKVMMKHQPRPTGPFQQIQMDFIGPLPKSHGKEHCLVLIDHFTRWVEVYPVAFANAATTAKIIASEFCPRWGLPCYIDSDQGTHFTGKVMKQTLKDKQKEGGQESQTYEPGQWVMIRAPHPRSFQPRWQGPHQVLLTSETALRVTGIPVWIHQSRTKPCPSPEDLKKPEELPATDDCSLHESGANIPIFSHTQPN